MLHLVLENKSHSYLSNCDSHQHTQLTKYSL